MAWWVRLLVTLVVAPLLWRAVGVYIGSQQGGVAADLLWQSAPLLGKLYLTYTLPAAAVLVAIMMPLDLLLRRFGLDLLVVGVAPLVACAVALLLARALDGAAGGEVSGLVGLAFSYGVTWALTIREPATSKGVQVEGLAADGTDAPTKDEALTGKPR